MKEAVPPSEKKEEKEAPKSQGELVISLFERFRTRPDTPKYTYEEQNRIGKLMEAAGKRFEEGKTPEAEKEWQEMSRKFKEGKMDKKHVSAIWPPLEAAKLFLGNPEEAKRIPSAERTKLYEKVNNLINEVSEAQKKEHMSDELVADTLHLMNELESYLK